MSRLHITIADLNNVASEMLLPLLLCKRSLAKLSFKELLEMVSSSDLKVLMILSSFRLEDRENKAYIANRAVTNARIVDSEYKNFLAFERPAIKSFSSVLLVNEMSKQEFDDVQYFCSQLKWKVPSIIWTPCMPHSLSSTTLIL